MPILAGKIFLMPEEMPEEPDFEETTPLVAEDGDSLETFETMLEAQQFMQEILEPFFGSNVEDCQKFDLVKYAGVM